MRRLLNSPLHLPPSLAVLSTIFSKWAENEWEERRRGSELERDGKRIDINSDRAELSRAWRRYLSLSLKVWGRGNGLMVTSRDGEGGGGWRANAYILWPLGSVPPLSWQGWVERPLKAWGSSSDLTTISPTTKLVGVCLDKWTWQPPTMRSPCRLTTPQAYHLVQPRVYVCRDFSIFHPTGVLMSANVTIKPARTSPLVGWFCGFRCKSQARTSILSLPHKS